ncbi:winged helix-turn-helix transcriptional regulator [Nocardia sp. NBC_01009]|uniref:winged helix-turn-helix transcriptional regulator n=1 Tax=Nocardia sp. NBC_01009 TaxID=2975996 RepID=UPI00386A8C0D|nr:helix-turn-helix transcriptional regulator [Nocardia sp. NBC_01009]
MQKRRSYEQNCPIAKSLDLLGERWTLLIFRELLGGARRYSDLRAELPGIASNLLAARLRELEEAGLIERNELPPPAARTVYSMSKAGWRQVLPILQSFARFGLSMVTPPDDGDDSTPLNGFLAGILLAFDPSRARSTHADYQAMISGRTFEFSVRDGALGPGEGEPSVRLTARAADLVRFRLADDAQLRQQAASQIQIVGDTRAVNRFRSMFTLTAS